jgi:hypothetical protein
MCRTDFIKAFIREYLEDDFERTPWSIVLSGPCGKFIILCIFLSLIMLVMMGTYTGIYVSSCLTHQNIICVPYSFDFWRIHAPGALGLMLLGALCSFWFCLRRRGTCASVCMHCGMYFCHFWFAFLLVTIIFFPFFVAGYEGVIVKGSNNSDIMFQYFSNYGRGDPIAYTIFLRPDGTNDTYPNSTCPYVPFSQLCPVLGPLRSPSNISGVFRCTLNAQEGLEPFSLYFNPLLEFLHSNNKLGIAFLVFFAFIYSSLMNRRLQRPDEWIGHPCCLSSYGGPDERTKLI